MAAALCILQRDGVLAGLNLQEVAEEAGVSRTLINRYFGSRQALLRAALDSRMRIMAPVAPKLHRLKPWMRGEWTFREFVRDPTYPTMVMLLALDGDQQFEPVPLLDYRLAGVEKEQDQGTLAEDADPLALIVMVDALICGYFVMRPAIARQLGVPAEAFDRRAKAAIERMMRAFLAGDEQSA